MLLAVGPLGSPVPARGQAATLAVPLTEGEGSRALRQRLDHDGYANRLGPDAADQARTMREGFQREWLDQRPSREWLPAPAPQVGAGRSRVEQALERERADRRLLEQRREAEQSRLGQGALTPGGLPPREVARARQRLQADEAAQDLGARMRRPSAPALPAPSPGASGWLGR